jgi:hypothetical protein
MQPFVEDEDVLVESENGRFLWDAVVVDVAKDSDNGQVKGYLVHFKNWSSRFDSWVAPDRVVETSPNNLLVQVSSLVQYWEITLFGHSLMSIICNLEGGSTPRF